MVQHHRLSIDYTPQSRFSFERRSGSTLQWLPQLNFRYGHNIVLNEENNNFLTFPPYQLKFPHLDLMFGLLKNQDNLMQTISTYPKSFFLITTISSEVLYFSTQKCCTYSLHYLRLNALPCFFSY